MSDLDFSHQRDAEGHEPDPDAAPEPVELVEPTDARENPPEDPYEGAVPPGYDWPTHGGYLGCLIGVVASCLIGGFIGSTLFAALRYDEVVPGWVAALLTVVVYIAVIVGLGRLGWVLGRRFYREYPQARGRTWGEHDDFSYEDEAVPPADAEQSQSQADMQATDGDASTHVTASSDSLPEKRV